MYARRPAGAASDRERLAQAPRRGVGIGRRPVPRQRRPPSRIAAPASGWEPSKTMSPPVRVPVLSRQMTSTRARPSTAGSSFTSTCRLASLAAPTANAIEVTSTSPSGIIAVSDAIVLTTACTHVPLSHACTQPPATIICALSTSRPIGPIPQPTHSARGRSRSAAPTRPARTASPPRRTCSHRSRRRPA